MDDALRTSGQPEVDAWNKTIAGNLFQASLDQSPQFAVWERLTRAYIDFPQAKSQNWTIPQWVYPPDKDSELFQRILELLQNDSFDLALIEYHASIYPHELTQLTPEPASGTSSDIWSNLFSHFSTPFQGDAIAALREFIQCCENQARENPSSHYGKTLSIVQSSGMGKSRLADELSKTVFTVAFTFRSATSLGYPKGDVEVLEYLTPTANDIDISAKVTALLGAALEFGKILFMHDYMMQRILII